MLLAFGALTDAMTTTALSAYTTLSAPRGMGGFVTFKKDYFTSKGGKRLTRADEAAPFDPARIAPAGFFNAEF